MTKRLSDSDKLLKYTEFVISQQDIISEFKRITQLDFEKTISDGNLCFARNNEELRDDFKLFFTPADLLDYFTGVFQSPDAEIMDLNTDKRTVPFPENAESFWLPADIGKQIRNL